MLNGVSGKQKSKQSTQEQQGKNGTTGPVNISSTDQPKTPSPSKSPSEATNSVDDCCEQIGNKAMIFSLKNQVGGLVRALRIFQEMGVEVQHIESRKSKRRESEYEIYVDIDCDDDERMSSLLHHLRHELDGRTLEEFQRSQNKKQTNDLRGRRNLLLSQPSVDNGEYKLGGSIGVNEVNGDGVRVSK